MELVAVANERVAIAGPTLAGDIPLQDHSPQASGGHHNAHISVMSIFLRVQTRHIDIAVSPSQHDPFK